MKVYQLYFKRILFACIRLNELTFYVSGSVQRFLEVGVQEVKPALKLLAIGFTLPLVLLILEILVKKSVEWTRNNEKRIRFALDSLWNREIYTWGK